jgi:hypothetical protein
MTEFLRPSSGGIYPEGYRRTASQPLSGSESHQWWPGCNFDYYTVECGPAGIMYSSPSDAHHEDGRRVTL